MPDLEDLLRDAVESGDWSALAELLDGDAVLDTSNISSDAAQSQSGADKAPRNPQFSGSTQVANTLNA